MSNSPSWKIFIPTDSGFEPVKNITGNGSINSVSEFLGYNPGHVYGFWHDYSESNKIRFVMLELFSRNVAYVSTQQEVTSLSNDDVYYFLQNLSDKEIYESYTVEDKITNAIKEKSLTIDFLAKSLEIEDPDDNGVFYSDKLGMYLYFSSGLLVDYQDSDGLGKWAKTWKQVNPEFLARYQESAKFYWGENQQAIRNEINNQAAAWANTPEALGNEFVEFHYDEFDAVNFIMLLVCHYSRPISLQEFLVVNHGRCSLLSGHPKETINYKAGLFKYAFDIKGNLTNITVG